MIVALIMGAALGVSTADAQEPINATNSATAPAPGHFIFKEQVRYNRLKLDTGPPSRRGDIEDIEFLTTLNAGVTQDVSLSFRLPVILRDRDFEWSGRSDRDEGIGDFTAMAKWRVVQKDTSALDTFRLSLVGGLDVRTGDTPFTGDSYDPLLGVAATGIRGRHGVNAALLWKFTTGGNDEPIYPGESTADLFRYDAAYLYRLHPARYSTDTHGAFYAVIEVNGTYETNGDHELFIAPGLMYEAAKWTAELSVQAPVWERVDHRAEYEFAIVAGLRFSF